MNRLIAFLLGLVVACWPLLAEEPKTKKKQKPQYERMLKGDDAKKAEELTDKMNELAAKDRYEEGAKLMEELLQLRRNRQGEDHWETINTRFRRDQLRKVAELSPEDRIAWRNAFAGIEKAEELEQKSEFAKALPFRWERVNQCRKVLGEHHPDTADSYNDVASNFRAQRKSQETQELLQKALNINRNSLGEKHPYTASAYNNLAGQLADQGKFLEAHILYQKALQLRIEVLGEDHPETAQGYHNLGANLADQGNFSQSQTFCEKALLLYRTTLGEDHPETANCYNTIAMILKDQGKFVEAHSFLERALEVRRKAFGEEDPNVASAYNNLALNFHGQGKYTEAQAYFQKALDIARKVLGEEHPDTAQSYNNMAFNLNAQKKYLEAHSLYEKAMHLRIKRLGEEHPETANSYNNVAYNLDCLKKYAEAEPLYQQALEIRRKMLGEYHPETALSYKNWTSNLIAQRKANEGQIQSKNAVRSYELARVKVAIRGLDRASFGESQSPYRFLAISSLRKSDFQTAFAALESNFARGLLDEFTSHPFTSQERNQGIGFANQLDDLQSKMLDLLTRKERTEKEQQEIARIVEAKKSLETQFAELTAKASQREIASVSTISQFLTPESAFLSWMDLSQPGVEEHWACLLRSDGQPIFEPLATSNKANQWTNKESQLPNRFREVLQKSNRSEELEELKKQLYHQRLAPLEKHLQNIKHLYVVGVDQMAGIPLETLSEKYTISYLPSGTYLARLKDRSSTKTSSVFVLGDPFFPIQEKTKEFPLPPHGLLITQVLPEGNAAKAQIQPNDVLLNYANTELKFVDSFSQLIDAHARAKEIEVRIWREGKTLSRKVGPGRLGIVFDKQPAPEALRVKRKADQLLASLRSDWGELPGTAIEIHRLKSLFGDKTQILTREEATEQNLEELRRDDKLKRFRYLHFATHGQANNEKAFESALILSPLNLSKEPRVGEKFYNGELSAKEVLEDWKLDAELVTLSACESGLGRKGGGDGLLGFAQAFLKAGSRAVCLSLWKVDDSATSLLMFRFYQNLLGKREGLTKPMPKAMALQEAKTWLKNLTLEEATKRSADISNGVARGKEKGVKLVIPKAETKRENSKEFKPFEHPRYWAAFILIGDPN